MEAEVAERLELGVAAVKDQAMQTPRHGNNPLGMDCNICGWPVGKPVKLVHAVDGPERGTRDRQIQKNIELNVHLHIPEHFGTNR